MNKVVNFQAGGVLATIKHDQAETILIVATSARMLTKAAKRAGFKPLVIDIYGDLDTRFFAEETLQIPSLAKNHLLSAIANFMGRYPLESVVYGSGFEPYLGSLRSLGAKLELLGNNPDVFDRLQDRLAFFSLLQTLKIPYPEVSFDPPEHSEGWLVKPIQSEGGVGIRRYKAGENLETLVYWQKYQQGIPHSVLFLADGLRSQVIGFNRQWTVSCSDGQDFIFSGIINHTLLTEVQKEQLRTWLSYLVPKLALKGLNCLDFIQTETSSFVLEINPRPPASMQLYDEDLFTYHIKACHGEMTRKTIKQNGFAAYQIMYAKNNTIIPSGFIWPDCAADIPVAESIINAGQPICSIIAHGIEPQQVLKQLKINQKYITNQLDRFQTYGICSQR